MDYKAKIFAARETWVDVGAYRFLIRRMGDLPMAQLRSKTADQFDFLVGLVRASVVGWDKVTEADLAPGGGDVLVPFDSDTFMVWLEDQEAVWNELLTAVLNAMDQHRARKAEAKNA